MIQHTIATEKNIPTLQRLANEIWKKHYPGILRQTQIDFMLEELYNPIALQKTFKNGCWWVLLLHDDEPIGFMSCSPVEDETCKIEKLYIHPSYHEHGYGRKSIGLAIEFARRNGAKILKLNVNRGNINSIKAYIALGFSIECEEDSYLGKYLLDDYIMMMEID